MFDLHMHTVWSDGTNTAEEMVQEAIRKGLETVGISDHSSGDPCGMTLEQIAEEMDCSARNVQNLRKRGVREMERIINPV